MVDQFLRRKNQQFMKNDRSIKQSWDDRIGKLCELINKSVNYYTTSSCSGRVLILINDKEKRDDLFLFVSHNLISFKELQDKGFTILVKHAPVATHQKQFLVAGAIKNPSSAILEQFNEEVELTETKKDGRDFILITSKNKNNAYDGWVFRKQIRWI